MNNDIVVVGGGQNYRDLYWDLFKPRLNMVDPHLYLQRLTLALKYESEFYNELYSYLNDVVYGDELRDYKQFYSKLGLSDFSSSMAEQIGHKSKLFMKHLYSKLEETGAYQHGVFPYVLESFTDRSLLFKRLPSGS